MTKKLITKTVLRTIIYQLVLVSVILGIFFISYSSYLGDRLTLVQRSIKNIFYPIKYDEKVEKALINIGRDRLFIQKMEFYDENFEIIKDSEYILAEEWYMCQYKYLDKDGNTQLKEYKTRIRWKPWEYYYDLKEDNWTLTIENP